MRKLTEEQREKRNAARTIQQRAYRRAHLAQYAAYRKKYRTNNLAKAREEERLWYAANSKRIVIRKRAYRHANPEQSAATTKKYQAANPEKVRAHWLLNAAIRSGSLKRPNQCELCKIKTKSIEGHHADYSKPLEVMWLCIHCHKAEHIKVGAS